MKFSFSFFRQADQCQLARE